MRSQTWMLTGDFHCGATTGLTPEPKNEIQTGVLRRFEQALEWFETAPDVMFVNGDAIDGADPKSKDTTVNAMLDQCELVADLVHMVGPKTEVIFNTGTGYHQKLGPEDFTKAIAAFVKAKLPKLKVTVRRKLKTTINKWFTLEARHFIGGSSIPHGRATPSLRAQMWNVLNAAMKARTESKAPQWPDLLVFSHRHYYAGTDNVWGDTVVLPAWSALGGVFGDEICDGRVDLGLVKLKVGGSVKEGWSRDKILFEAGVVPRMESR